MDAKVKDAGTGRDMQLIENLPFETDNGIAARGRVGLIVLASDYTIEHEWRQIFAHLPGLALYQSRIFNDDQITPETLRAMEPRIRDCADVFLPGAKMDVIAYGCTSASMAIGEEKVFQRIREARPACRLHDPDHGRLCGVRRVQGEENRRVDTVSRRCEPDCCRLYSRPRVRRSGVRLFQRRI